MHKLLIATLLAIPMLKAQVIKANRCVHQAGDNPDWARPDFDDRQWSQQMPKVGSPYIWTRCRMDLSSLPRTEPLHIGVNAQAAWELFVDGIPAGSQGDIRTGFFQEMFQQQQIPAGARTGPIILVALRQLHGLWASVPSAPSLLAGGEDSLSLGFSRAVSDSFRNGWPYYLDGAFNGGIGMVLLFLFFFSGDRKQRELLWFGISCIAVSVNRSTDLPWFPLTLGIPIWCLSSAVNAFVIPRIFFALAGRPLPAFYFWSTFVAAGMFLLSISVPLLLPIAWAQVLNRWVDLVLPSTLVFVITAAAAAFWPLGQVPRPLRLARNLSLLYLVGSLARLLPQLPGLDSYRDWVSVGLNVQAVMNFACLLGLFVVIAKRHRQISLDRAELQGEMKAAQEVQRLLTSSRLDVAPWAAVEAAYLPAKEVGGDFYYCQQRPEGQWIVVGDVSGKGLRAGMLASVALGAIQNSKTSSPAALLVELNSILHRQTGEGFVTCCAAVVRKDGQFVIANAGHPSPYVDGQEFPVEASLPLGIVPGSEYTESTGHGESITLVSDGVVEAENAQRELFGFDRTRDISGKPAREIAEAAKAWGQTDDITVVSVRRIAC